jgi:polynucleotide 5'-triphosphatase
MDVDSHPSNGHSALPPLSLSILGVEPIDEFIREIADFVHAKISQRPEYLRGTVEVEAKIGVIRDKAMGSRLMLPVISETGEIRPC